MQYNQQNKAIKAQAEATNQNLTLKYAADALNQQANERQAMEQRTDLAMNAARKLAQARVVAGAGRGSLASMARNIQAGTDLDLSRIDVSQNNAQTALLQNEASAQISANNTLDGLSSQASANQMGLGLSLANTAMSAAGSAYSNIQKEQLAKKYSYFGGYQGGA
jgi:ribosomal protein S9